MSRMDTDGDGGVQIDEWLAFMQKHELAFRKAVNARWPDAAAAFKALDSDGNGSLEVEELQVHQPDAVPAPSLCTDIRLRDCHTLCSDPGRCAWCLLSGEIGWCRYKGNQGMSVFTAKQ